MRQLNLVYPIGMLLDSKIDGVLGLLNHFRSHVADLAHSWAVNMVVSK